MVPEKSRGIAALGVFWFFGAAMALLAGISLIWRGTLLDRMWGLNAAAYARLAPYGKPAGVAFLALSIALLLVGIGWSKRRVWSWRLAVVIIATQVLGDIVNALMGDLIRGGIGVFIAGALLFYLLQPRVRSIFMESSWQSSPTPD